MIRELNGHSDRSVNTANRQITPFNSMGQRKNMQLEMLSIFFTTKFNRIFSSQIDSNDLIAVQITASFFFPFQLVDCGSKFDARILKPQLTREKAIDSLIHRRDCVCEW